MVSPTPNTEPSPPLQTANPLELNVKLFLKSLLVVVFYRNDKKIITTVKTFQIRV